jgi:hypothetical protein
LLALACIGVAIVLFITASVWLVWARRRLSAGERASLRRARGRFGHVDAYLSLATLAAAIGGVAVWGTDAAPLASLPLFIVAGLSSVADLRLSRHSLEPETQKAVTMPSVFVLIGIAFWTLGSVMHIVADQS